MRDIPFIEMLLSVVWTQSRYSHRYDCMDWI